MCLDRQLRIAIQARPAITATPICSHKLNTSLLTTSMVFQWLAGWTGNVHSTNAAVVWPMRGGISEGLLALCWRIEAMNPLLGGEVTARILEGADMPTVTLFASSPIREKLACSTTGAPRGHVCWEGVERSHYFLWGVHSFVGNCCNTRA